MLRVFALAAGSLCRILAFFLSGTKAAIPSGSKVCSQICLPQAEVWRRVNKIRTLQEEERVKSGRIADKNPIVFKVPPNHDFTVVFSTFRTDDNSTTDQASREKQCQAIAGAGKPPRPSMCSMTQQKIRFPESADCRQVTSVVSNLFRDVVS